MSFFVVALLAALTVGVLRSLMLFGAPRVSRAPRSRAVDRRRAPACPASVAANRAA